MRRRWAASGKPARGDVVARVLGLGRAGNDAGHGGMAKNVLEKELSPAGAVELGRPLRQGLAVHLGEQGSAVERLIDDDRHAALCASGSSRASAARALIE